MKKIISILSAAALCLSSVEGVLAAGMGVGTHFDHLYPIEENVEKAVGIETRWVRDSSNWMGVEQTKGVLQIREHNMNAFKRLEEEGINLLCGFGYGNTIYTPESKFVMPTEDNEEYYNAFLNYVEFQLKELKDYVDAWEVWNEPNWSNFNYYGTDGTEYAKLYLDCAELVKKYDPTAKLVCGVVMGHSGNNLQYGKDIFSYIQSKGNVNELIDVFSIHKYTNDAEGEYVEALNTWESVFDEYGYIGDVWMTENGASSHTDSEETKNPPITEDEQATYIARYGVQWERYLMENDREGKVFWYDLTNDGTDSANIEHNYGLVDNEYNPKPAYYAAKIYNNLTNDKKMVNYTENGTGYVAEYSDGVDKTYIIYDTDGSQSVELSGDIAYVYDCVGTLLETIENPDGAKTVEPSGKPIFIECVSDALKFTKLQYNDNKNVLEIAGIAPGVQNVTITLEKDSVAVQTVTSKVSLSGNFKKSLSVDADGEYVVKVSDGANSVSRKMNIARNPEDNAVGEIKDSVVIYDAEANKVTVKAKLEDAVYGEVVSVAAVTANKNLSKLTSSDFAYIGETTSDFEGYVLKTFAMPDDAVGEYKIVLGRRGLKTPDTEMFFAGIWNYAYVSSLDVSADDGDITVSASVSNYTGSQKTVSVMVAEYTSDNKLIKVSEIYDTLESGEQQNYSKSIAMDGRTGYYKAFAWDSTSGMVPLCEAICEDANVIFSEDYEGEEVATPSSGIGTVMTEASGNKYMKMDMTIDGVTGWDKTMFAYNIPAISSGIVTVQFDYMKEDKVPQTYMVLSGVNGWKTDAMLRLMGVFYNSAVFTAFENVAMLNNSGKNAVLEAGKWYTQKVTLDMETQEVTATVYERGGAEAIGYLHYTSLPDNVAGNGYMGWPVTSESFVSLAHFGDTDACIDNIRITNSEKTEKDYAYSFAVVGDTQTLTSKYPETLEVLYDWIRDNAEEKKMKWVFGLGDITDNDTDEEWALAKEQIAKLDGVVPYSLIRGNHDSKEKFVSAFPYSEYADKVSGSMSGDMLNTYQKFTVGDTKYMVVNLDWGVPDDVVEWADGVIAANPDYKMIVVTHGYLNSDGTTLSSGDGGEPTEYSSLHNNGDELWDMLIKKHSNIILVMSGHISTENIVVTKAKGDNGNTVTQMLIDPQTTDQNNVGTGLGLVAMLYFSEDGKTVDVEYYSTLKQGKYLSANQFSMELDV